MPRCRTSARERNFKGTPLILQAKGSALFLQQPACGFSTGNGVAEAVTGNIGSWATTGPFFGGPTGSQGTVGNEFGRKLEEEVVACGLLGRQRGCIHWPSVDGGKDIGKETRVDFLE